MASTALRFEETIVTHLCQSQFEGMSNAMLTALPPLSFRICSQVIPETQQDIHLTNINLSLCVRSCLSCETGSRAYKDEEDSAAALERTYNLERKIPSHLNSVQKMHTFKNFWSSERDALRSHQDATQESFHFSGFCLAGAWRQQVHKAICADNTSTDGLFCKYLLSY